MTKKLSPQDTEDQKNPRRILDRDYAFYVEPEGGINDPKELNQALCDWAAKEHHDLEILEDSMEPQVVVDGIPYVCMLGEPSVVPLENALFKKLNLPVYNRSFGRFLGFKWIYFYRK